MADVETKETKVVSTPEKKVAEESAPVCEKPKVEKKVVEAENDDSNSKTSENGSAAKEATSNGSSEEKESEVQEAEQEKSTNGSATENSDACTLKRKSVGSDLTEVDAAKEVTSPKKAKLAVANEKSDKPAAEEAPVAQTNGIEPPTI